jgi:hypothetical protein
VTEPLKPSSRSFWTAPNAPLPLREEDVSSEYPIQGAGNFNASSRIMEANRDLVLERSTSMGVT